MEKLAKVNKEKMSSKSSKKDKYEDDGKTIHIQHHKVKKKNKDKDRDNLHYLYESLDDPRELEKANHVISIAMRKDYEETIKTCLLDISNHFEDLPPFNDYPYFRINPTTKFVPKLNTKTEIFSERQLKELHMNLPYYQQFKNLKLLYSPSVHGISMKTFYLNTEGYKCTIIAIKDDNQHIFGGYLTESIRNSQKFYGTGESFVFTFHDKERIHCYQSTMINEFFAYSDMEVIAMGGSDNHFSLVIRDDFLKGHSRPTETFNNPCLAHKEDFFIKKFEVWTFDENN